MTNPNIDLDNLDAFEATLFNKTPPVEPAVKEATAEEVEDHSGDVEPASPKQTDAELEEEILEEETLEETPKQKKKQTFQDRINELTAKTRETERREQALLERLAALEAATKKEPELPPVEPAGAIGPQPDEVDENGDLKYALGQFDPEYIRDFTRFTIAQEAEAFKEQQEAQRKQAELQTEQQVAQAAWNEKMIAAEAELPDIREKGESLIQTFDTIDAGYGEYLASTLMALDNGPEVLYYLSDNPDETKKIVASGPVAATIALGKLDAQMTKPKATVKKVSEAPTPPPTRARGSGGRFDIPDDTDDLEAFERKFFP